MIDPVDRQLELDRAAALCDQQRYRDAASRLRVLLATDPHDLDALALLGHALLGDDDAQGALMAATSAIAASPESDGPHRLASIACSRLAMTREAIFHAEEAARLAPDVTDSHLVLAQALVRGKSDLGRARQVAAQAVAFAPHDARTHLVSGMAAAASGDRFAAERAFHRALEIDPQNTAAHNELARLHLSARAVTNPAGLAAAATGFAAATVTDPRRQIARRNLDHVVRVFLSRVAYLIFIDAYIVARLSQSVQTGPRLLPVAVLIVPVGFALRFINGLDQPLRVHLWRMLAIERSLGIAALCEALAAAAILIGSVAPQNVRLFLVGIAAISALAGRLLLFRQTRRRAPVAPSPLLGTPVLWILALALASLAVLTGLALTKANDHNTPVVIGLAIVLAFGSLATLRTITRRRSSTPRNDVRTGR